MRQECGENWYTVSSHSSTGILRLVRFISSRFSYVTASKSALYTNNVHIVMYFLGSSQQITFPEQQKLVFVMDTVCVFLRLQLNYFT